MIALNIEIVIKDNNGTKKESLKLSSQEFIQLRNKINEITGDILDPPFVRVDTLKGKTGGNQ